MQFVILPYSRKRVIEEEIRRYPGEIPRLSLGASLLIVFLFFLLYLIMYLMG